jgi:hypothetical protein
MKSIMGGLVVFVMVFAIVSVSRAESFSSCRETSAVSCDDAGATDWDRSEHFPTGTPYPCTASPAYVLYTDSHAISCDTKEKMRQVPEPKDGIRE